MQSTNINSSVIILNDFAEKCQQSSPTIDDWVSVEDRKPTDDIQLLVTNGNGFYEILYFDSEEQRYKKPFAYDEHDRPTFHNGGFTHWMELPNPPKQLNP